MPGTIKIWWHDGAVKDVRYNDLPVVNEPELGFESLAIDAALGPATTGPAPTETAVAIIESDVNLRYRVVRPGSNVTATAADSKPLSATGLGTDSIGIAEGQTISFVEI